MVAARILYTTKTPLGVALSLSYLLDDIFLKDSKEFIH
ncbi:hypothetical protein Aeqsu_0170 [Aequorivita sublithincola DSM 14238]|uniref:Uncharacterized protein n=1 Tax=Aequorivita sublithincola (strain DSM 14238 / LMG 21431 / ACAM 643 / 9-3) TaxID=746697 RepID=I3YRT0_AEQSU|nr:hypothetical protein Aeqsu_0170 [Aequorivita sublithincola DSM 14238]